MRFLLSLICVVLEICSKRVALVSRYCLPLLLTLNFYLIRWNRLSQLVFRFVFDEIPRFGYIELLRRAEKLFSRAPVSNTGTLIQRRSIFTLSN